MKEWVVLKGRLKERLGEHEARHGVRRRKAEEAW